LINTILKNNLSPKNSPAKARARRKEGAGGRNSAAPERLKFCVRIFPEIRSDFVQGAEQYGMSRAKSSAFLFVYGFFRRFEFCFFWYFSLEALHSRYSARTVIPIPKYLRPAFRCRLRLSRTLSCSFSL